MGENQQPILANGACTDILVKHKISNYEHRFFLWNTATTSQKHWFSWY